MIHHHPEMMTKDPAFIIIGCFWTHCAAQEDRDAREE